MVLRPCTSIATNISSVKWNSKLNITYQVETFESFMQVSNLNQSYSSNKIVKTFDIGSSKLLNRINFLLNQKRDEKPN